MKAKNRPTMQEAFGECSEAILTDLAEAYHSAITLAQTSSSNDRLSHLENIDKMLHLLSLTVGAIADQ